MSHMHEILPEILADERNYSNIWVNYVFLDDAELIEDYHDRFMALHGGYEECD